MIPVEFTPDELNNLAKLIDTAIRSGGIDAAKAGVPLFLKLEQAAAATPEPAKEPA